MSHSSWRFVTPNTLDEAPAEAALRGQAFDGDADQLAALRLACSGPAAWRPDAF